MKAEECFKKPGDVARCGEATVLMVDGSSLPLVMVSDNTHDWHDFEEIEEVYPGDDWQPLLTRDQWQAEQDEKAARVVESWGQGAPSGLTLRKLGPGEAFVYSKRYMFGKETGYAVERGRWFLEHRHERQADYDYYELPDLTEAQSEPTCEDGQLPDGPNCPKCGGNRAPSGINGGTWVHTAAPNPVGERLMDPPEEGTPVIRYGLNPQGVIFRWLPSYWWDSNSRYYEYHGEIPTEPKPEPPKLPYPERLKLPGIAGIARDGDGDWGAYDQKHEWKMYDRYAYWVGDGGFELLVPLLFPELYSAPYSDVEAKDSWIDNPAYEGGEA